MIALILAGGGGTRLWPVSRQKNPKQVETIVGAESMLKTTYDRVRVGFKPEDIYVATGISQSDKVISQLSELSPANIITEPCRRDTASAIGYALLRISHTRPNESFVLINSDAYIKDTTAYLKAINLADQTARATGQTVLIGVTPTYPETGYGYIKAGAKINSDNLILNVERFVEKPDLATAKKYIADGSYYWNPTLIVGLIKNFLALYANHLPDHAKLFEKMRVEFGEVNEDQAIDNYFKRLPAVSVDYGILEKMTDLLVIPADFGWLDIGNWRTVREVLARGSGENVVRGQHVDIDSFGNLIHCPEGKLIATVGLSDMIIVDTGDALLVCPQNRAHEVKDIVAKLKEDEKFQCYL